MNSENVAGELFQQLRNNSKVSLAEMLNDFNRGEIGVLGYLVFDKDNVTSGELSEKLNVSTARVASILNSLEAKGYIIRNVDKLDKRKIYVKITMEGKLIANNIKNELMNKIINVVKEIGEEEIKEYVRISLKIRNILTK